MLGEHDTQDTAIYNLPLEIVYLTNFYIDKPSFHIRLWTSIYLEELSITKEIPELKDSSNVSTKLQIKLFRKAFRTFEKKYHDIRVLVMLPQNIREDNVNPDNIHAITAALLRMSLREKERLGPAAQFIAKTLLYPRYLVRRDNKKQEVLAIV